MVRINQMKNIDYQLKQPNFKQGVQTNYGIEPPKKSFTEDGLFTTFIGAVKNLVKSNPEVKQRAEKIQKGLEQQRRIDLIA